MRGLAIGIAICLAAGLLLGVAHGVWQFGPHTDVVALGSGKTAADWVAPAGGNSTSGIPVAVVQHDTFEFGKMEAGEKDDHDFVVRNEGTAPLRLRTGETTCKCTFSELDKSEVAPGESVVVTLSWEAKGHPGPFRQSAIIHTNDPKRPQFTLVVNGEITQSVDWSPQDLVFTSLPTGESDSKEVKVWALRADNLQIVSHTLENQSLAAFFDVKAEPLTAEELTSQGAKSGAKVTVTVKPGLPLGPVKQRIILTTNLERASRIEIPVEGTVTSDISLVGQDWAGNQLRVGRISSQQGMTRTLRLVTRGSHRDDVAFKIVKVWPEALKAELGEKTFNANRSISLVPLTISLPAGTPLMNHLGTDSGKMGEVVLETTHPDVKELKVLVQFAVTE
jgi:hypothetical protein